MPSLQLIHSLLEALAGTVLTEVTVILLLTKYLWRGSYLSVSSGQIAAACALASFATLPYLWLVLPIFIKPWMTAMIAGEILVILVEAFWYLIALQLAFKRCLILSIICNVSSILVGEIWRLLR